MLSQTESLQRQIVDLNNTLSEQSLKETSEADDSNLLKQLEYIEKLESQLKNKQNTLTQKNRELIELKNRLSETAERERGDGVDVSFFSADLSLFITMKVGVYH